MPGIEVLFYRLIRNGLTAIFKQRSKGSEEVKSGHIWEKSIPGRRNSKYKDPETEVCVWLFQRNATLFHCDWVTIDSG